MKELYLIRHGKTEANLKHLYCGSTDLPLSPEGREELKTLQYHLSGALYITSGMKRTEETLRYLFGTVPHETDSRFREVDFGDFEMKSYEELRDDPDYQAWITGDNEQNIPPHGESGNQMQTRVLEGLEALRNRQGTVVLVTHGGVIAFLMEALFPEEKKNRYQWQPRPGHGYKIAGNRYDSIPYEL